MRYVLLLLALALSASLTQTARAEETTVRLYDAVTAFVNNPDGKEFTVKLDVRDINHSANGPSEMLVKIYPPDGKPVVREVMPDDGIDVKTYQPVVAGWDHEAWYYATVYSRGLDPAVRWSAFSDPKRLAAVPKRTLTYNVKGGQKGIYRIVLAGTRDLYVTINTDPGLKFALTGGPDWIHGVGDNLKRTYIFIPKGTIGIRLGILENDQPATRKASVSTLDGKPVLFTRFNKDAPAKDRFPIAVDASRGLSVSGGPFEQQGQFDDQVLAVDVPSGPNDYLLDVTLLRTKEARNWRGQPIPLAALAPDPETAKAVMSGAIYHDGQVFFQMYQVRMYEWLKQLKPEDVEYPAELAMTNEPYFSPGSHQTPKATSADKLMHNYPAHKNRGVLNAALKEMLDGMLLIGPTDSVVHGRNLAYEMGTYSYFYHRAAWRILQQSDAPQEVKEIIREFIIQIGDRLAFCRGLELVNGNSLASLLQGLRYCVEATKDPLQTELFDTYWKRFTTGGFGERIGVGASGGVQESFGYDYHYGGYITRGWQAVLTDLKDERFRKVYNGIMNLYSYTYYPEGWASPFNSRTGQAIMGGAYSPDNPTFRWKGQPGPDFTESISNANEFFAARRSNYYVLTYHGRITPTWMGEGFHGQIGFSGGTICQIEVPGKGPVISSRVLHSYGEGGHLSQWEGFHLHTMVGHTADGNPLVTANSEHPNARLVGNTVSSDGEVRQSSTHCYRTFTFEPNSILCTVELRNSIGDSVMGIYGGGNVLRTNVVDCYEMIPFEPVARVLDKKTKEWSQPDTAFGIGADGKTLGPIKPEGMKIGAILLNRGGYGARIDLDTARLVKLGKNNTLLVELSNKSTDARYMGFAYRIMPFSGSPENMAFAAAGATAKPMPTIDAVGEPEKLGDMLAKIEPSVIKNAAKQPIAEVRFALSGKNLAVMASVTDEKVTQEAAAWKGSCVEVFGAMPDAKKIGHVFLQPAVEGKAAKASVDLGGKQTEAPQIKVHSVATKKGYDIFALIPLASLKVEDAAKTMQFEFQASSVITVGKKSDRAYANLFGSKRAYEDTYFYGTFKVGPEEVKAEATSQPAPLPPPKLPSRNRAADEPAATSATETEAPAAE